jgi:hypothetical protein
MTTARYTITTDQDHGDENVQKFSLLVKNIEDTSLNTDFIFIETMSRARSVGNAICELLAIEVDHKRIFEPHLGVVYPDYTVDCALVGDMEIGTLPPASDRLFSVNTSSRTIEIGDGTTASKDRDVVRLALEQADGGQSPRSPSFK